MWRQGLLLLACCGWGAVSASAESRGILVLTETLSASGAPAGVQAWLVDETFNETAGPLVVPGHRLGQAPKISPDGRFAIVHTRQRVGAGLAVESDRRTLVTLIDLRSFSRFPASLNLAPGAWETVDVFVARDSAGADTDLVFVETHRNADRARVRRVHLELGPIEIHVEARGTIALPGHPIVASMGENGATTAVVTRDRIRARLEASLIRWSVSGAEITTVPLPEDGLEPGRPTGVWEQGPTAWWMSVAVNAATSPVRGRITRMYRVDMARSRVEPAGAPLPGFGSRVGTFNPPHDRLWMSTYREPEGFGYVVELDVAGAVVERVSERALTRSTHAPLFAESPNSESVAMASGLALEIHPSREESMLRREFAEEIGALSWSERGLLLGTGGTLVRIDPRTGRRIGSQAFHSGVVRAIFPTTLDGAWPQLAGDAATPARIHLDANVPARWRRSIRVSSNDTWTLTPFNDAWSDTISLTRSPGSGGRDTLHLALSTESRTDAMTLGTVGVLARAATDGRRAVRIPVTVAPTDRSPPRVVWLRAVTADAGASIPFDSARRLLAGPPTFASHTERSGPLLEPPRDADVVVVDLAAATEGALTREVLLTFVRGGGGLLLIAPYSDTPVAASVARWLEPVGFVMDPGTRVAGRFTPAPGIPYLRRVDALTVEWGSRVEGTEPVVAALPGATGNGAILAHRNYGFGRIAVLASSEPLGPEALTTSSCRLFLRSLFEFLVGGETRVVDSDFDGLPDTVEDADGDGEWDAFETDPLNPDTDGDFIPDGVEDANQDGQTDESETDPRKRDTDGDGIADGADADPMPFAGAPIINRVEPDAGPAEGGTLVRITGRNFPVGSMVWVGRRRANRVIRIDSTELVAFTPERSPTRGTPPHDVEVGQALGKRSANLEQSYSYTARSIGTLHLNAVDRIQRQYDAYGNFRGFTSRFSMRLEIPEIRVNDVSFALRMPIDTIDWMRAAPSPELLALDRNLQLDVRGQREYVVRVTRGAPITGSLTLGEILWQSSQVDPKKWPIVLSGLSPRLSVQWGGMASMQIDRLRIPHPDTVESASNHAGPP